VFADGAEHVAHVAVRKPVGQPNLASGFADPEQLLCRLLLVGGEHHPHRGEHHVERSVGVGQVLRVPYVEGDIETLGRRTFLCLLDEVRDVVYAVRLAETAGGGDGSVAAAGRDVEDFLAGANVHGLAQLLSHNDQCIADPRVVARDPRLLLALLDLGQSECLRLGGQDVLLCVMSGN
jgi:hypothetical protein